MRRSYLATVLVLCGLSFNQAQPSALGAQAAPLAVIERDSNCSPAFPVSCKVTLVNRSTSSRTVVNLERRQVSNFPPTVYDRNLNQISEGDAVFEVLLSAGDRVPLVPAVAVTDPGPGPGQFVRYEYTVLGSHQPTADDVADAGSPNVADYFRLVVAHTPGFDNTDICRIGANAHPARLLRMVNFHPTKTIVVTHRNTAPRYGSNPQTRVDYVRPGGATSAPAPGCVTDIAAGFIQISEVRFM
ncbi:MAG: hypothetical protein U9R07_05455 [Pseudomonadota bacterium]|nr:hypothetical protein [Pseudomonadota bacterium]